MAERLRALAASVRSPREWRGAARAWVSAHPLRATLLAIALVGLLARLGYVLGTGSFYPVHDAKDYWARGLYLFETHHFINEPGTGGPGEPHAQPDAYWPPFYIMFLAFCDGLTRVFLFLGISTIEMPRLLQAGLGAVAVGLIGVIALRLFGRRIAIVSAAFAAVFPPIIYVGASLDSESLLVPLMIAALAAIVEYRRTRKRWLLISAGVLTALSTLTHSDGVILLLPFAVALWPPGGLRVGRWRLSVSWSLFKPLGVMLLVFAVVMSPWWIRNEVKFHSFVPVSTSLGNTLAGTYNNGTKDRKHNRGVWIIPWDLPGYYAIFHDPGENEVTQNSRATSKAVSFMEDHPVYVLDVIFWNTKRLLDLGGFARSDQTAGWQGISKGANHVGVYALWLVALLAIYGCFTPAIRRGEKWIWLIPLLMYLSVVYVQSDTPRFRAPVDPFLMVLGAAGAVRAWDWVLQQSGRRRPELRGEYANT